jgi:hypothetical protein
MVLAVALGGFVALEYYLVPDALLSGHVLEKAAAITTPLFMAFFLHWLVGTVRGRLTLYEDHLTYRYWFTRTVYKKDIKLSRSMANEEVNLTVVLVMKDPKQRSLTISAFGPLDMPLAEWLDAFPNAQFEDEYDRSQRLLANPAFGPEAGRERAINREARWLTWFGWASWPIGFWTQATIVPPIDAVGPALAWLALLILAATLFRRRWCLSEDNREDRLGIGQLALWPIIFLSMRAFGDLASSYDVQREKLWTLIGIATVLIILVVAAAEGRFKAKALLKGLVLYLALGFALVIELNRLFDPGPAQITRLPVLATRQTDGDSPSYHLRIPKPSGGSREVTVDYRVSLHVKKGGTVCLTTHPGRFDMAWSEVKACSAPKP